MGGIINAAGASVLIGSTDTMVVDVQPVVINNIININGLSCDEAEVQRRFEELSKEDEYGLYIDSQEVEEDE